MHDFETPLPQPIPAASTYYDPLPIQLGVVPKRKPLSRSTVEDLPLIDQPFPDTIHHDSRPRLHHSIRTALRWWIPELLAIILSIAALLVIVIVLRVYEGRSIDDLNLPKYLTLNGLVAAISTFDRVFLVVPIGSAISQEAWLWFRKNDIEQHPHSHLRDLSRSDAASRGAWGSFCFVFTSPRRYLALFGAVLSLLSLAITTFTQQLIVVRNIPVRDQTSALQPGNVPRSEYYKMFTGNPAEDALSPTLPMTAAIYAGMMEPETTPAQANCPSGNCTWPETTTLAVCGGCAPITYQHMACNESICNFTMPSGSRFELANFTSMTEGTGFQTMSTRGQHWNTSDKGYLYIANFDMMGAPYNSFSELQVKDLLQASECALWMCVNTYATTQSSGKQTQKLASSFHNIDVDFNSDTNYTFSYSNTTAGGSSISYAVNWLAAAAFSFQFGGNSATASMLDGTVFLNLESAQPSSDITNAIWAGTQHQQKWIQNLALSMTNVVRTNNQKIRPIYNGTTYVQGVQVDWWWLALPIATIGGSIVLLILVMTRTARSDLNVAWKGSPLAYLLLHVDDDIRRSLADSKWRATTVSGIEHGVGDQKVTLRKVRDGQWMFNSINKSIS